MQVNHIRFSHHGWFDVISHVFFVFAPGNDFIIFKHSLSESFKLQPGIFLIIESPTIATVCNDCNDCNDCNSFPVDFTLFM